jgi:hypothetical protein
MVVYGDRSWIVSARKSLIAPGTSSLSVTLGRSAGSLLLIGGLLEQ